MRPDTRVLDVPNPGTPAVHLLDVTAWSAAERELRAAARSIKPSARSRPSSRSCAFPLPLVALHAGPVGVDIEFVNSWGPAQTASILTGPAFGRMELQGDGGPTAQGAGGTRGLAVLARPRLDGDERKSRDRDALIIFGSDR